MTLKAAIRHQFPFVWGILRKGKALYQNAPRRLLRRNWKKTEVLYNSIVDAYAERNADFFFIQVGANDGVRNDPIGPKVKKYGWHGVLIEPQPDLFEKLKENYRGYGGLHFENAAVSSVPGIVSLHKVKDDCLK